jgi:phosphoribosyl 1,2-cyclic phosphodiesterase
MRIRFWGTRGSIPVAANGQMIREKVKQALHLAQGRCFGNEKQIEGFIDESLDFPIRYGYGGDTSCVQIEGGDEYMMCDMGSGLRRFGQQVMMEHGPSHPKVYHFFMSHVHWDHIMGFPFFPPAYIPGNTVRIYGGHNTHVLEDAFRRQQSSPCFPVYWDQLGADIFFTHLEVDRWHEINGFRIKLMQKETAAIEDFFRDADCVIFDAMYSLADMITVKEDWGHSSNILGVDLCLRAKVKHYCMFHHEPAYNDETLYTILQETKRYEEIVHENHSLKISTAYDNLVIDI